MTFTIVLPKLLTLAAISGFSIVGGAWIASYIANKEITRLQTIIKYLRRELGDGDIKEK